MNGDLRTKILRPLAASALAAWAGLPLAVHADEEHPASARCPDAIVGLALRAAHVAPKGEVRDSACKPIAGSGRTLVAVAYAPKGYETATPQGLPVHVALLDDATKHIVASGQTSVVEDAAIQLHPGSLNWDAAPLELARVVMGYGLHVSAFNPTRGMDSGEGPALTLFAVTGRDMRPVISDLKLQTWQCEGGPCGGDESQQTTTTVGLSLADSRTHGMRDIVLTTRRTGAETPHAWVARFDGSAYDLRGWASDMGD
jgi:hypothetical protein